jgi:uncharacterized protein YbcI
MNTQGKQVTKGKLEARFTKKIGKFEKEYLGTGPIDARTYFTNDMALVRLLGVLTPAEEKLAEKIEGRILVKDARRQFIVSSRSILEGFENNILGTEPVDLFSDFSSKSGERIIVLSMAKDFDRLFSQFPERN